VGKKTFIKGRGKGKEGTETIARREDQWG